MGKRSVLVLILSIFLTLSFGLVYAQDKTDIISDVEKEYPDAELETDGGIGPGNFFYFLDKFFDRFGDDLSVREERVAEIRSLLEEGRIDEAREILEDYFNLVEELEKEIDPEKRDEARRSVAAILKAFNALGSEASPEVKEEFIDRIFERESRLITAVEIASKIKELCEALSELDPLEYSRVCRTDDDSPRWQRDLHERLTDEQREEAEDFFNIMIQCFETSGESCRCEDISVVPFAEKCSLIAPLAFQCDQGDEAACDKMDEIEEEEPIEDLLPDYLRDVLRAIENRFEEERFEHYGGPRECEGIRDKAECEEIIFRNNAPRECLEELLDRNGISFDRDYGIGEAQRDCEAIMFDLEAPQECIDAGLTDFRDCGVLMFQLNAPQECIDAGLTGEHRSDERKCREIVGDFGSSGDGSERPFVNFDCRSIEDPDERLVCYDQATQGASDYGERFQETHEQERICAERCSAEGGAWDFSSGQCECHFRDDFDEPSRTPTDKPNTCADVYEPVCGVNGNTYSNSCFAGLENVEIDCGGECPCGQPTPEPPPINTAPGNISNTTT